MKKDHKIRKRLLALVLTLTLVVTYMPTALFVYAGNEDTAVTTENPVDNSDSVEGQDGSEVLGSDSADRSENGNSSIPSDDKDEPTVVNEPAGTGGDANSAESGANYAENKGVVGITVKGKAAESEELAMEALAGEEDVDSDKAESLAEELFREAKGPYDPVLIDGYDRQDDGNNIEDISTKWVTEDTVDDGDPLHLYVKPADDNRQSVMLQVDYSLSGQYDYAPGKVQIIVPAYIFKDRKGHDYGTMVIPYPESNDNTEDFNWILKDGKYILTNTKTLSAATKGFIQFSIAGMLPHNLVDMQESTPFSADIKVTTKANNKVIALRSNSVTATFDMDAALTSVKKRQAGAVQIVSKENIPEEQWINGEEYYVLINWYMTVSTTSNTYYRTYYKDSLVENQYDGFIVKSYGNTLLNEAGTQSTNEGTSYEFKGYRPLNGNTYMVQTAYPYSKFEPSKSYTFKNRVEYYLVEDDHPASVEGPKSDTATVSWYYEDPQWPTPGGHFMVNKNGNDGSKFGNKTRRLTWGSYTSNDLHLWSKATNGYYGIYASALNQLRDGNDVVLSYTIDSVGYVMPWLFNANSPASTDGQPAAKKSKNYTRPVEITTVDTGLSIGRNQPDKDWGGNNTLDSTPLEAGTDYTLVSLEFPGNPYVYKAMPQRISATGSYAAKTYSDGTFKYVKDTDNKNWPDVDIYIQTGGSDAWTKFGTFSWENESFSLVSGETVEGRKVELPENTTNFKEVVTLQNDPSNPTNDSNYAIQAGIDYDVRVETKLNHESSVIKNRIDAAFAESNAPQLYIFNSDRMTANRADGDKEEIVKIDRDGYNTVRGYELDIMVSPIKTGDFDESVDFHNGIATVHYSASVEEKTLIGDEDTYNQAVADGTVPVEKDVVWRDLLPPGMTPDLSTIDLVREGDELKSARYYSIKEIKPDYTGPDRMLLVVKATLNNSPELYTSESAGDAQYYCDVPQIKFDATIDTKSIMAYGYDKSRIHNVISFESLDIDNLGTVEDYMGEPDDPHVNRNIATKSAFENEAEKDLMTDLSTRDTNSFLYAGAYTRLVIPSAAISGLEKEVQVNNDGRWSTGLYEGKKEENERIVYLNGMYSYRITYAPNSADTVSRDLILYDSLENFYAGSSNDGGIDENAPRWQGTFAGVDTSMLEAKGCDPVVYYSKQTNLPIADESDATQAHPVNTVLAEPVWYEASKFPGKLSDVKAVAVDASKSKEKDSDGNAKPFEIGHGEIACIIINMNAPTTDEAVENEYIYKKDGSRVQGIWGDSAQAYNNTYILCENYNKNNPSASEISFIRKDYTKVGLDIFKLDISKVWDDDDDRDGKRPETVTIQLTSDDEPVPGKEVTFPLEGAEGSAAWSYTFDDLPYVDEHGRTIDYSFKEKDIDGEYTPDLAISGNSFTLTNKHIPEKIRIEGKKEWDGDEDVADTARPKTITIILYADGEEVARKTVRPDDDGKWSYSFNNLYKYRDGGQEIVYTVEEIPSAATASYVYPPEYNGYDITNIYHPYGDLEVYKETKDTTEASKDKTFEFVFDFKYEYKDENNVTQRDTLPGEFKYFIFEGDEQVGEGSVMSGGSISITGGQVIRIKDIDENALYTVTELDTDGFYQTGIVGADGVIKPNATATARFENTYRTSGSTVLTARKFLENHAVDENTFGFAVYQVVTDDEGNTTEVPVRSTTADPSGSTPAQTLEDGTEVYSADINFGSFRYSLQDDGKTYTYIIREMIPDDADENLKADGFTYDNVSYRVDVSVSDNGDGTMTCTKVYYDAEGNVVPEDEIENFAAAFHNKYEAEGEIRLPAWKNVKGRNAAAGEFTFNLLDENGDVVGTATNDERGYVLFPPIKYTEKDAGKKYKYTAVEVSGNNANMTYDTSKFGYIVTVNDNNNGTLDPEYVNADPKTWETENVDLPKFVNTEEPGGLKVTKKISSDSTENADGQTFTLNIKFIGDVEGITFPQGFNGWDEATQTASVVLHGNESFEVTNVPAGTQYQVTEETVDGWMPIAQDNVSGTIKTVEVAEASITNQYQPNIATAQLFGLKWLDNKAAEEGQFTFTLDEKSNTSGKVKIINENGKIVNANLPLTVSNLDGGFIQFPVIVYEEAGEHTYTITEMVGDDDTIDYDAHKETAKVTVTEDTNGMLVAAVDYTTGDVEFRNKTHPGNLKITKVGDTDQYTDDEFYFLVTLNNNDGAPISSDADIPWYTEKTNKSGLAKFFSKAGDKIGSAWESAKEWFKDKWNDIDLGLSEPLVYVAYGAEGDVEPPELPVSGTYAGISWQVTAEGELILGNGGTQTMTYSPSRDSFDWPWNAEEFGKNGVIKSVSINGTVKARGSLAGMFDGEWKVAGGIGYSLSGGHSNLTSIDLTGLDTSEAISMYRMFCQCKNLVHLKLGPDFKTGNVDSMASMFSGCSSIESLDVSGFDTSNVKTMQMMFYGCEALTSLDVSGFDTSNVTTMNWMFMHCEAIPSLDVTNFNTSNVTNMGGMFSSCKSLTELDVTNFNTSNVTDMSSMFSYCNVLPYLDVTGFNTSKVTKMGSMFAYCNVLPSLDVTGFDTSKVTDMSSMFNSCSLLSALDVTGFNTSNVKYMNSMFSKCEAITTLDVSNFNTSKVTDMGHMFREMSSLTQLDLSNFDTTNVKSMTAMFYLNKEMSSLDVSSFNTEKVESMEAMFRDCRKLQELDLSSFSTNAVKYGTTPSGRSLQNGMYSMFSSAGLRKVILGPEFSFVEYQGSETIGYYLPSLNTPSSVAPYTGRWIREDNLYGPYAPRELSSVYNDGNPNKQVLSGVWIWEVLDGSCKVRFDANGGYTTAQTQILKSADDTVTMPSLGTTTRPGYDLVGWNTKADGSGTTYSVDEVVNGLYQKDKTITLYAMWEDTTDLHYVVEHYQQNVDLRNYTLAEREILKVPLSSQGSDVTPDVKDYAGFILPDTQTGTVEDDYTLTIKYYYDRITYTVKFDANGGEGRMDDLEMVGAVSRRLPENEFTKENAMFKGWNTEPDGSGTFYANAQRVNNLAADGKTITLYAQWIDGAGSVTPTNGQIIVHCHAGETIVIPDIPAGTTYTVQEINNPNGWSQSGIIGEDGTIVAGTDSEIIVNNSYKANGQVILTAQKKFEGGTLEEGAFTFVLLDEEGNELGRKACSADGNVVFDAINYSYEPGKDINDIGTHHYTIAEVSGTDGTIKYDGHVEEVTVEVTDPHLTDPKKGGVLDAVAKYDSDGAVFVNTLEYTEVSGTKTWEDNDDQDGIRPQSITINLFADGQKVDSKTVTKSDGWNWTFTGLPKYDYSKEGDNKEIVYTITEESVTGYETEVDGFDVTNTHEPETTSVSGSKTWSDKNNQDGARPSAITIHLLADGTEVSSKRVTAADEWAWEFTGLPKYRDGGVEIIYTITEDPVEGYTTAINGFDVTNTHRPETTSISGEKTWEDGNDMDGIRPSSIVVYLLADGSQIDSKTVTPDSSGKWAYEFSDLPKYKAGGQIINYTVDEKPVEGYTSEVNGSNIANSHYTATGSITFKGTKTLTNMELQRGMFTFVVKEGNTEVVRATNEADGTITYPAITYTHHDVGEHTYTITEMVGDLSNISYSEQTYTVTVTVTDNHDGTLSVYPAPGTDDHNNLSFTNKYLPPELEITKTLDGYVDGGEYSNVTLAFKVEGYAGDSDEPVYTNYAGMTFAADDVVDGVYTKTIRLTDLPSLDRIVVTEVYSGNYTPGEDALDGVEAVRDPATGKWIVSMNNTHSGYTPGSGVVNKYKDGNITSREGLTGSGGEPAAGNEGN